MSEVRIESRDIIIQTPAAGTTDTSSGKGLSESKMVRKVIISSESSHGVQDLYHINKKLNREYTVTDNSSSKAPDLD